MSYQIKSTPYFRRMFNNSKKNGQLQRLREEYERIQEFNDRTIELKMRQVRLKRLFREIEDIKDGGAGGGNNNGNNVGNIGGGAGGAGIAQSGQGHGRARSRGGSCSSARVRVMRRRHLRTMAVSTPEQRRHHQRVEALTRARELGKEISRRNAEIAETGGGGYLRNELRVTAKMQAVQDARREAVERRERAAKRISYGNDQSRQNLLRQLQVRQKRLMGGQSPMRMVQQSSRPAQVAPSRAHTHIHHGHAQNLSHGQLTVPRPSRQKHSSPRYLNRYPDFRQLTDSQLDFLASQAREEQQQRIRRENNVTYNEGHIEEVEEEDFNTEELAQLGLEEESLRRQMNYSEEERLQIHQEDSDDRLLEGQTSDEPTELDGDEEVQGEDRNDGGREEVSGEQPLNGKRVRKTALEQELQLRQQVQQEDEAEEAEEQRRRMHLREETSPLRMARFSLSSTTTTATATTPKCVQAPQRGDDPSDDSDMVTAPSHSATIAAHQPSCFVPPNNDDVEVDNDDKDKKDEKQEEKHRFQIDAGVDPMPSLNHWRKISLMMPFFCAASRTRAASALIEELDDAAPNVLPSGIFSYNGTPAMESHQHQYQQQSLFQRQQEHPQPQPQHHLQPQFRIQQPQRQTTVYRAPHSEYLMSTFPCVDAVEL
ncbi:hypothetical protein KR074_001951 [Drosophila pseudoananassae]|nr:hypothetical protein KR074_001951 [Drosophila pseudoananassae]